MAKLKGQRTIVLTPSHFKHFLELISGILASLETLEPNTNVTRTVTRLEEVWSK